MNLKQGTERKLRHGSRAVGIIALVIAAVILLNVGVSFICSENRWFIDLTPEGIYTLSDTTKNLLHTRLEEISEARGEGEEPVKIDLIFCAAPDLLCGNSYLRYIYYTALALEKEFSDVISVSICDVWNNPSSVDAFRINSYATIYQTDVIVSSGSEYRVYSYKDFFAKDSSDVIWAYTGETNFMRGILAVTRADAPICALTVNHGEPFATEEGKAEYSTFLKVIENSGYDVVFLDLETQPIPQNCRLIITLDPQTDFATSFLTGGISEIAKLREHLDNAYSYMVFADADTPELPVLEEYLEEWGIVLDRHATVSESGEKDYWRHEIIDRGNAMDQEGSTIIGQYVTEALGGTLTYEMREAGSPPKVIFENAASISFADTYQFNYSPADEETGVGAYIYGSYEKNDRVRDIYPVFTASETAFAYAKKDGDRLLDEEGALLPVDTKGNYQLMTVSRENRIENEGSGVSKNNASYVCAVGSTAFASNEVLDTNAYGNTNVLLRTLRTIGSEVVPVGINVVRIHDFSIGESFYMTGVTTADGNVATQIKTGIMASVVLLVAMPGLILAGVGVYVLVRRRTRS